MLKAYMVINLNTNRCIVANEVIQKTLDEEMIMNFIKALEGVVKNEFVDKTIETKISELTLYHGENYYNFRWGNHLAGVILSSFESKKYATILAETIYEAETRFGEELKTDKEELIPYIAEILVKNFKDLIYEPVDDIILTRLLNNPDKYFMHTGREGALVYEKKKHGAALGNFVHSQDTITMAAIDEIISILRTDVINLTALEKKVRLLSKEDLALSLRQLFRLNIIECYVQPDEDELKKRALG